MPSALPEFALSTAAAAALLAVAPVALALLRPLYATAPSELTDFAVDYLNSTGQALLALEERPATTLLAAFPDARQTGLLAYCRQVFTAPVGSEPLAPFSSDRSEPGTELRARRQGGHLAVSFSVIAPASERNATTAEPAFRQLLHSNAALRSNNAELLHLQHELLLLNEELEARVRVRTVALEQTRTATQRQLQAQEAFYQVFEQTPAAIALLRGEAHRFEFVNEAYQQLFPDRPLQGRTLAEALPEAADQGFVALLDRVYHTGETFFGHELPLEASRTAGSPPTRIYFSFTYQAYREHGQTVGVSIFAHDVTTQVQARLERERQQQRLERLFMQAPAAVCILSGPALVFELINPGYEALFPGRGLLGRPLLEALPEIRGHAVAHTFQQVYETGITHQELGMCIPLRCPVSGVLVDRYFNYMQQARHDEQGRVDGVLAFAFEVTAEVRGRQQVLRLNEELLASNRELGTANEQLTRTNVDLDSFIYAASHDLKEPITNLEGLVEALREVLPPAAAQDALVQPLLGMMEGAVARFQLTIAQLSDVARLQHTADHPAEEVDLATLVQHILLDLAPALTAGGRLTVEVQACPSVSFAPQYLRSVVYNLLSNALKYADPHRPAVVQLRCRREATTAVLEVQDNGLGLDAGQQARLFGLFERLHTHVEGAGIGLYMVRKIVENVGGTVTVSSEPGVGSTFVVMLPYAD